MEPVEIPHLVLYLLYIAAIHSIDVRHVHRPHNIIAPSLFRKKNILKNSGSWSFKIYLVIGVCDMFPFYERSARMMATGYYCTIFGKVRYYSY